MRSASKVKREQALEKIPDAYREAEEGEYIDSSYWYLDGCGGMRKGDLKNMTGAFRYCKRKHQVIITAIESETK